MQSCNLNNNFGLIFCLIREFSGAPVKSVPKRFLHVLVPWPFVRDREVKIIGTSLRTASRDCIRYFARKGVRRRSASALNAVLGPKASPSRAGAHFTSFLGLVRRPRAASRRRYFSINFFSPRPEILWPRVPRRISTGCWYIPGLSLAIRRADTEAKWPRINQRRPIINELRPRPPRVCIKTRLFVTHLLERVRLWPAFVITWRRQTVGIRRWTRRGPSEGEARVGPAISSRQQTTSKFAFRACSPPFLRGSSVLPPSACYFDWL